MNTITINEYMKPFGQYKGTYPRDCLPEDIPKSTGVIINTDASTGPGKHWVAVYNGPTHAVYFDSFGLPPLHKDIIQFLDRISPSMWGHNTITFQSESTNTCGLYCLYFLTNYFNGGDFINFRKIFNFKQTKNDLFIKSLYKSGI